MRAPFQVLVVPYRQREATLELLVLQRADTGQWQWVAGGGEVEETPVRAAQRELHEELGVCGPVFALQSRAAVPAVSVVGDLRWGEGHLVVTEYAFCVDVAGEEPVLSAEHVDMRWVAREVADDLLAWDSNRTAAWEVAVRHCRDWWSVSS